ncbi:MAG: DUF1905 domain-containing protein [Ilumatobacteraceae bacterium]
MNAADFPQAIDIEFDAVLEKDGAFATLVTVAGSTEALGTGRAVRVSGSIDGHQFAATLMPSGRGPHWLPLHAAICKAIGKQSAGDTVHVHLTTRHT